MGLQNRLVSPFLILVICSISYSRYLLSRYFHDLSLYIPNCQFIILPHPDDNILLLKLLCVTISLLHILFVWSCLLRFSTGSRITLTVSSGSTFSQTIVLEGNKSSGVVSADGYYDGQSRMETKKWWATLYPMNKGFEV